MTNTAPAATLGPSNVKTSTLISSDGSESERATHDKEKKRREFFGSIKRRLARSKTKANAAGQFGGNGTLPEDSSRSLSTDRNVGPLNNTNLSRRSSMSESSAVSGLSTASSRTYVHEASTLVLETTENSVKR
jgi:hypothetical protein